MASNRKDLEKKLFEDASLELLQKKKIALELLQQLDEEERKKMVLRFDNELHNELMVSPEFLAINPDSLSNRGTGDTPSIQEERPSGVSEGDRIDAMRKKFEVMKRPGQPTSAHSSKKESMQYSGAGLQNLKDISTQMGKKYPGFKGAIKIDEKTKEEVLNYSFKDNDCQYTGTLTEEGNGETEVSNSGPWTHRDVDGLVNLICDTLGVEDLHIEQKTVYPISMMVKACELLEARGVSITIFQKGAPESTLPKTTNELKSEYLQQEKKSGEVSFVNYPQKLQDYMKKNDQLMDEISKKRRVIRQIYNLSHGDEADIKEAMDLNRGRVWASEQDLRIHQEAGAILQECLKSGEIAIDDPLLVQYSDEKLEKKEKIHQNVLKSFERNQKKLEAKEPIGVLQKDPCDRKTPGVN